MEATTAVQWSSVPSSSAHSEALIGRANSGALKKIDKIRFWLSCLWLSLDDFLQDLKPIWKYRFFSRSQASLFALGSVDEHRLGVYLPRAMDRIFGVQSHPGPPC